MLLGSSGHWAWSPSTLLFDIHTFYISSHTYTCTLGLCLKICSHIHTGLSFLPLIFIILGNPAIHTPTFILFILVVILIGTYDWKSVSTLTLGHHPPHSYPLCQAILSSTLPHSYFFILFLSFILPLWRKPVILVVLSDLLVFWHYCTLHSVILLVVEWHLCRMTFV